VYPNTITLLAFYNYDIHQLILIIFGRHVSQNGSSQSKLYFPTSPNWRFCTTWQNSKMHCYNLFQTSPSRCLISSILLTRNWYSRWAIRL